MKAIIALLLGLVYQSYADDDSVLLEFESPDSDEISAGDEPASYGGLIIQVRQDIDGAPTIALGSEIDDYEDVYCLNFLGLFEASQYDTTISTSADYTAIPGTSFDFANANCVTNQAADTVFSIQCTNIGDATLTLTFTFVQDTAGDYGLEYIINLADYDLSDSSARLVMVQSLEECGDVIDLDEADPSSTETPEPTETEEPDETEPTETEETEEPDTTEVRRRLLQADTTTTEEPEPTEVEELEETEFEDPEDTEDTEDGESVEDEESEDDAESLEEEDGISEDDSGEFDAGFARFVVNGQALDVCGEDQREIESTLVYQPEDEELHIVFDPFNCTLVLDPFYGLDDSKYQQQYGETVTDPVDGEDPEPENTEAAAASFGIMIAMVTGLFAYLW